MPAATADPTTAEAAAVVGGWRRWLVFFVAFWLVGMAWALATPPSGGPDEPAHVFRAASVVRGEIVPARTDVDRGALSIVHVPASVAAVMVGQGSQSGTTDTPGQKPCYASKRQTTAACLQSPTTTSTATVPVVSGAARYNPVYYVLVGWPILLAPNEVGIVAMRIISAGLCAALFASAFCSVSTARRGRIATVGLLIAVSPGVVFLAGVVNPNGLEIAAAVSLWAAGLRLALARDTTLAVGRSALYRRIGVAASLLVLSRNLSPLWLFVAGATVLAVAGAPRVLATLRDRLFWRWGSVAVVASLAAAAWILASGGGNVPSVRPRDVTYLQALGRGVRQFDNRLGQLVGTFGWNDTPSPIAAWIAWGVVGLTLLVAAVRFGTRRQRLVLVALTAFGIAIGFLIEATQYHLLGLFWQTRYSMPVLVGVPLLAGLVLARRLPARFPPPYVAWVAVGLIALTHVLCFLQALIRNGQGLRASVNPFAGDWHPAVGTGTVLVVLLAGLGLLGYAVREVPDAADVPPGTVPADRPRRPPAPPEPLA